MTLHILFTYGTLKRHHSNHYLLENSEYLGTGRTKSKYAMYCGGIPYVIKNDPVSHISGELYQIDTMTLRQLDRLEGHPHWYCREEVEIMNELNQTISAWLYFYPEKTGKLNSSGTY